MWQETQKSSKGKLCNETGKYHTKKEISEFKERQIKLECHDRRNNLLFGNILESTPENCEEKVRYFIKNTLGLDCESVKFEIIHRLGVNANKGRSRPIVAQFCYFKGRQLVWKQRDKLTKSKSWIAEDFADEVDERRKILKPVLRKAIELKKSAFLRVDKIVIEKKTYTVDNLSTLPQELNPAKLATVSVNDDLTVLSCASSPLSNSQHSAFELNGQMFFHNEQYFQYNKARVNDDLDTSRKVLAEKVPAKCKQLGDKVKVINSDKWEAESLQIMYKGCKAKFEQNRNLRQFLMSTGTTNLVEGRNDPFWGAGKWISDLEKDPKFQGSNHLGKILMDIRRGFSDEPSSLNLS